MFFNQTNYRMKQSNIGPKKAKISKNDNRSRVLSSKREKSVTEISAGGIVFKRTPQGVRLALIADPYKKWAFAKGHREPGEGTRDTALRETREEMGLGRLRIKKSLGKIDFWFIDRYRPGSKGTLIHKYVYYYLMEAPMKAKGQPQKKEKISKMIWVTPAKAVKLSGYKDVRPILNNALEWLKDNNAVNNINKPSRARAPKRSERKSN